LASGKTFFIRSFLSELNEIITSPSYSIIKEYNLNSFKFIHIDLYRISSLDEAYLLGLDSYLNNENNILAIEWWELIRPFVPFKNRNIIKIKFIIKNDNTRDLIIKSNFFLEI